MPSPPGARGGAAGCRPDGEVPVSCIYAFSTLAQLDKMPPKLTAKWPPSWRELEQPAVGGLAGDGRLPVSRGIYFGCRFGLSAPRRRHGGPCGRIAGIEAKARISMMVAGADAVSEHHRELLVADPADRPTPAGAARAAGMVRRVFAPERHPRGRRKAWISAKIAAFATTPAPAVSLFDMATGPAPTGPEPATDEDCL